MKAPKSLSPIVKIAKYTMADEVRHKSFIVMFIICAAFVLLIRGCYKGDYMVNGQWLDAETIAWNISKAAFNIIAAGVMFIAALLSMRIFKRDRDEGMQACILSKPIDRWQYVTGKLLGLWALLVLFMFLLHGIIFFIALMNTKAVIPEYLIASLVCSVNLLFMILAVFLLSLLLPDVVAFLCVMGIGIGSFVAESIYSLSHSQMMQTMMQQADNHSESGLTWWKVIYYLWPKLSGTQHWASSLIGNEASQGFGPVHPLINILLYCFILGCLLFRRFRKEDIV
ncbi:MAG: ABC transporter permease subunit [Syntrophales bacterium]|jgi:ABC-type transport system involved in multi-copper enzyme maturation permease subunit